MPEFRRLQVPLGPDDGVEDEAPGDEAAIA
jgi:hypothetical protein